MDSLINPASPRRPVTQLISDEIISWIATGKLPPGSHLPPEADLARQFGVSKPSVRESLKQLVAFGAIEISHGKPATVRAMNSAPLVNFFHLAVTPESGGLREAVELRRGLEVQGVLLATQRATPADIAALEKIMAQLEQHQANRDLWVPAHVAFHVTLIKAAHNRFFAFMLDALTETIERSNRLILAAQPQRDPKLAYARHLAIFKRWPVATWRAPALLSKSTSTPSTRCSPPCPK